jgi:NADH-quinone oxidoreductase subunit E
MRERNAMEAMPTQFDVEKIGEIIESYGNDKSLLISILQDIQVEFNYLPRDALEKVSEILEVPLSQVFSVASFYRALSLKPRGRHIINVCLGTACHVRGGKRLVDRIERELIVKAGETTDDFQFTLETVNCLGACALGPIMVVDGKTYGRVKPDGVSKILQNYE